MYDIYLKNFYWNGSLVKDEVRLYSVPIQNGDQDNVLTDPSVSSEVGKTGTLEFTIYPNHPYYHAIAQMRTIMRVDYDGDTIFRGRILTVDNTLTGVKKVHCEGDMAFLLDSYQMGSKEEERPSISLNQYIHQILDNHNSQMGEAGETDKFIYPGFIPGEYTEAFSEDQMIDNVSDTFGSDSHEQSMNALEALTKEFGGFFRTRYSVEDGKTYFDWCRHWFYKDLENSQPIAITQNIIDAQSNSEVDNIFTALIPVGKHEGEDVFITGYRTDIHGNNNRILVPQITQVFSEAELNNGYMTKALYEKAVQQYGIIYKVQNFSNAETQDQLWEYACDWIKNNYVGGITDYDLSAIDMHHVNGQIEKYMAGDCIPLELPSDMTELDEYNPDKRSNVIYRTILSAKYNLHNPDKNSYTAGISSDILNYEYGTKSTSKSKSSGGGGGKGSASSKGGGNKNQMQTIGGDSAWTEKQLDTYCWAYIVDKKYNNDLYKELEKQDKIDGTNRAKNAEKASHVALMKDVRAIEVLDDGSKEERNMGIATTMVLDAEMGVLNFFTPAIDFLGVDAWGNKLMDVKTSKSLEIDGYNGYLNMKQLPSYHDTPIADGIEAIGKCLDVIGEKTSYLIDPLNVFNLRNKEKGAEMKFTTGNSALDSVITSFTDGQSGLTGELKNLLLPNGSTDVDSLNIEELLNQATILQDGGGNNGSGTTQVGKQNSRWLIQMNQPLQYNEGGQIKTIPNGTIDAEDYAILSKGGDAIPSIFAQVGVFKTLIADNIRAIDLKADKAEFNTVKADVAELKRISANTITTNYLNSHEITIMALKLGTHSVVPRRFSEVGYGTTVLTLS